MDYRLGPGRLEALQLQAPTAARMFKRAGTHQGRRDPREAVVEGWTAEVATKTLFGLPAELPQCEWDGGVDVHLPDGTRIAVKCCGADTRIALRFSVKQDFTCAAAVLWHSVAPGHVHFEGWLTRGLWVALMEEGVVRSYTNKWGVAMKELSPEWLDHRWSILPWAQPHLNPPGRQSPDQR